MANIGAVLSAKYANQLFFSFCQFQFRRLCHFIIGGIRTQLMVEPVKLVRSFDDQSASPAVRRKVEALSAVHLDFMLILSQFYPDFILIFPDFIQIFLKTHFIQICQKFIHN